MMTSLVASYIFYRKRLAGWCSNKCRGMVEGGGQFKKIVDLLRYAFLCMDWSATERKEQIEPDNPHSSSSQAILRQYTDCMQTLHAQKLDCYVAGSKNIGRSQWVAHKGTTILSHTPNVSFSPRNCMLFIQLLIKFIPQVPQIPQWDFCMVLDHTPSFFSFSTLERL